MTTVHFKLAGSPPLMLALSDMTVIQIATELLAAANRGEKPIDLRFPGAEGREVPVKDSFCAVEIATCLFKSVADSIAFEEEARRQAGWSPRGEEAHILVDAEGNPVAIRKRFQY